jgi:triosephosphate isomerase
MIRKKIAAGNWKMNTSIDEGVQLASEVVNMAKDEVDSNIVMILCVPFTHLDAIKKVMGSTANIHLGAQNCHHEDNGAFTGEISPGMLASLDVKYVILGHSERREYFHEDGLLLLTKIRKVLNHGMTPIFCCGEKLTSREKGDHFQVVQEQLQSSLFSLTPDEMSKIVIAYEPVWAIGTGVTASTDQAQEMHDFIRKQLSGKFGKEIADGLSILYGGSVKDSNAGELFACPDVDGGLIGGASLKSRSFVDIAKSF